MKPAYVAILALALNSACGTRVSDKDRPNNSSPNNESNITNNTTGPNNGPNNPANNTTGTNNTSVNNTSNRPNNTNSNNPTNNANNPTNNANNPTNNANNPTNNANNTTCTWDNTFFGQIGGLDEHGGGVPTPAALTGDAGLADVMFEMPPQPDDFATPSIDEGYKELVNPIFVSGATVTGTGPGFAGNRRFWLEDANDAVQVFLGAELPVTVRVGDQVEFSATALQNFEGHPQIAQMSGFTIISSGNAVPYRDVNNRALRADDYARVVRLAGTLGAPYDCGGTNCYDFTYAGGMATFRSRSTLVVPGSCVQFSGPLYSFPGPMQNFMAQNLQLDSINFDWMWVD